MKQVEVQIGGHYIANVSGHKAIVRLDSEVTPYRIPGRRQVRGWSATNIVTGRTIYIKSAARLHRLATADEISAKRVNRGIY